MKKFVAMVAMVAAIGMGSAAMAQTAMPGDAMHGDATHGAMGTAPTMVCRAAMKGETANSHMGSEDLMCKTFDFDKAKATFMKMMKDASASGTPTAAQEEAAYQKAFGDMNLLGQHN